MGAWLRLAWRLQRWEVAFAAIGCLGLAGLAAWQAIEMRSMLTACGTPQAAAACGFVYPFQETNGTAVQLIKLGMGLAPFAVGLVLGVPLVAREIERGTAQVAWPLARSRVRWLAWRGLPVLALTVAVLSIAALASDTMVQAYQPKTEIGFLDYGARGVPMVLRGLTVMLLSVAVGAALGRILPALLVGIALAIGLQAGLDAALVHWLEPIRIASTPDETYDGALVTDVRYRTPEGLLISEMEAGRIWQANETVAPADQVTLEVVPYGIGPDRYWEVVLRESAMLAGVAILTVGASVILARRRRPV